jgi:FkbM family methyltransferase
LEIVRANPPWGYTLQKQADIYKVPGQPTASLIGPIGPHDDGVVVSALGHLLFIPRDEAYLYYATYVAGQYSQLQIRSGDVVVDAGANVGDFTLLAAAKVGATGRVIAVEPNAKALTYLDHNLAINRVPNVEIVRGFLGANVGRVSRIDKGTYSSIVPENSHGVSKGEQTTLDEIARQKQIDHFDIVKMDVEGSEVDALNGCSDFSKVRELVIEVHSVVLESEVRDCLGRHGFSCEVFDTPRLVAHTVVTLLRHPLDVVDAERKFGMVAFSSLLRALRGVPPSPSLDHSSGVRILHFYRAGNISS